MSCRSSFSFMPLTVRQRAERQRMLFGDEHVQRYEETDGAEGHEWQGTTALILTTTGRKSGQERKPALIYQKFGDDYLVVASKGGADAAPTWFLNLEADPEVQVQVLGDKFKARARPPLQRHQEKTQRGDPGRVPRPRVRSGPRGGPPEPGGPPAGHS